GGSIGIQLYIAQSASISFYCIGFAEPLQPLLSPFFQSLGYSAIAENILVQKQIIATSCFLVFFTVVMVGANFTLKLQTVIFIILLFSIGAIFAAPFIGTSYEGVEIFTGEFNLSGNRALTLPLFLLIFTQFFPAVTGIDAGVGMSGDLKNPQRSLVRGTFFAIGFTFCIYLLVMLIFSAIGKEFLVTGYENESPTGILLTNLLGFNESFPYNIPGALVFGGILFATGSSALSVFMTAPRTLQSLARDKILPGKFLFLKNDFTRDGNEPRFAALPTFFIALLLIWAGNINFAAMVVGICFLIVYGWVNGAAFLERVSNNPTFRPTSKNHWSVSLYGFLTCLFAIVLFSWQAGIAIVVVQYIIFRLILKYKTQGRLEGVWWGVLFTLLTRGLKSMGRVVQGSKNFRPIVAAVAFSGKENKVEHIAYLGRLIAEHKGLVHLNIIIGKNESLNQVNTDSFGIPSSVIHTENKTSTLMTLTQSAHPAGIVPNTVLMEYTSTIDSAEVVRQMLSNKLHILILKNAERFHKHENIDIWWSSEKNGNLMLLLAYIINSSREKREGRPNVRILHMPESAETQGSAKLKIENLLTKARLSGEIVILEKTDRPLHALIEEYSNDKDLVLAGLPGTYIEDEDPHFFSFSIDEFFFDRDLKKYHELPAILFVRSTFEVDLIEE
ncbi:MAG: amino acid permease, partial [Leptospirales bacterium]